MAVLTQPFNEYLAGLSNTTAGLAIVAALDNDDNVVASPSAWFFAEAYGMGVTRTAAQNRAGFTAVLAAAGKNPILLPEGALEFAGDQFSITGDERFIVKAGSSSEGFVRTTPTSTGAWFNFACTKLTLRNVRFDGNRGALASGDGWTVLLGSACLDRDVEGCTFTGGRGSLGYGLVAYETQNEDGTDKESRTRIVNCRADGNDKSGIWVGAGDNIEVHGNTTNDNDDNGLRVDWNDGTLVKRVRRVSITNNRAKGNAGPGVALGSPNQTNTSGSGTRWGADNHNTSQITVSGNHAWENGTYGIMICGDSAMVFGNHSWENDTAAMLAVGTGLHISLNNLISKSGGAWAFDAGECKNSIITFNRVIGGYSGISIGASNGTLVLGNYCEGQPYAAITGTPLETDGSGVAFQGVGGRNVVKDNRIAMENNAYGILFINGYSNVEISGNDFWAADGADVATAKLRAIYCVGQKMDIHDNTFESERWGGAILTSGTIIQQQVFDDLKLTASTTTISAITPYPTYEYSDRVAWITVTNGGSGYTAAPTVVFTGGGGSGATATAYIDQAGVVKAIRVDNGGSGYSSAPTISFTGGGGGSGATATAQYGVPKPDRTIHIHTLNAMTLGLGIQAPEAGRLVEANQTMEIRHVYNVTYLNGGTGFQKLSIVDGITAPSAVTGKALIYVDTADGDLKVIFGDGTVKTIVTDT